MNNQKKLLTNTKFSSPKKRCWINTKKKSNKINSQWFTLAIIHGIYVSWSRISKWRRRCVWKAICTLAVLCWNCQKLKVSRLIRYKKKLFQKLDRNKKKKMKKIHNLKNSSQSHWMCWCRVSANWLPSLIHSNVSLSSSTNNKPHDHDVCIKHI